MDKNIVEEKNNTNDNDKGATMLEYILIAGLIGLGCIAGMNLLVTATNSGFSQLGSRILSVT